MTTEALKSDFSHSKEVLTQESHEWLRDETGKLNEQELRSTIDQLRELGVAPVVIATNNSKRLETFDNIYQTLESMGYGEATSDHFRTDIFVCQIDYNFREINCIAGEKYHGVLSSADLKQAEQLIANSAKEGNPTEGFKNAYEFILKQIQENVADPTPEQELIVLPTATIAKTQEVQATSTPLATQVPRENQPQSSIPEFVDQYGGIMIGAGVGLAVAAGAITGEKLWLKPRRELNHTIDRVIAQTTQYDTDLSDVRDHRFYELAALIQKDYPEQAEKLAADAEIYLHNLEGTLAELHQLDEVAQKRQFKKRPELVELRQRYEALHEQLERAHNLQLQLVDQIEETNQKLAQAENIIFSADSGFQQTSRWYEQVQQQNSFLPSPDVALTKIAEMHQGMQTAHQEGTKLVAADTGVVLMQTTESFRNAVEQMVACDSKRRRIDADLEVVVSGWNQGSLSKEALLKSANWHIRQTVIDLTDDALFDDVPESVRLAESEMDKAQAFAEKFTKTTDATSSCFQTLAEIQSRGYELTPVAARYQQESQTFTARAVQAIETTNDWKSANNYLDQAAKTASLAKESFEAWITLRDQNTDRLTALSAKVASLNKHGTQQIRPVWEKLQTYVPENYAGLEDNYTQAFLILGRLFDDPEIPDDLASQAARLNSMEEQSFDLADRAIADMFQDLDQAQQLFDQLKVRLTEVEFAEQNAPQTIPKAEKAIASAKASYAGELDRLVTEETELEVQSASQKLDQAKTALGSKNYLLAQRLAQEALNQAFLADQSADSQVSQLQTALSKVEQLRANGQTRVQEAASKVSSTSSVIVSEGTREAVRDMHKKLEKAELEYGGLIQYEDQPLLAQAGQLQELQNEILADVKSVESLLASDVKQYQRARQRVIDEIESAQQAIASAGSATRDFRAGSSGDFDLSQAESILPNLSEGYESYGQLDQIREQARQAREYANSARQKARREIEEYEAEQRRKEEMERREREQREAEERRRRQSSYSSSTSSSFSISRPSSSPRPSSGSSSFGGIRHGGGTKF